MIVVQIHMTLPTINHVLICLSELRQLLSWLTNFPSHIQKQLNFLYTILRLTINMIDKVTIRAQWLGIMLLLGMAVRVMSAFSWNFPVHDLTEPWNLLRLLFSKLI